MKKVLFPILALVLALGLALVPANLVKAAYLPTMPLGTGNFGIYYGISSTGPAYPNSGYHWDDPATTTIDERDIPSHYMKVSGIHVASPLGLIGSPGAGDALDFHWVWVGAAGDYVIWDMGMAVHGVRVYPAQDHGPYLGAEFDEFDVLGSNSPTADISLWDNGVEIALYYDDINNIRTHDGVKDYTFGINSYQYIMVRTNALGGGDFEIDAVEEIEVELPPTISKVAFGPDPVPLFEPVSWTFLYTVTNTYDYTMTNIRVKDNFGANLYVDELEPGVCTIDIQGVANRYQTYPSYYDTFQAGFDSRFNAGTGSQDLGGVSFDIGQNIIILHGSESTPHFPSSVTIPVSQAADKIHFLGNVAGWSQTVSPGTKIGSYVINYGDATSDTVDLIKDTNIDEWLISVAAHSSTATTSVLTGPTDGGTRTWHLDLLTVDLGAIKYVDSIEFKDAGNKPAPVLFAVTTEITTGAANPSDGTLDLYERTARKGKGSAIQYRFLWDDFTLDPGESATLVLVVSTAENPADKQEFTSEGWQVLNSGANVKWIDDLDTQQSAESGGIEVWAGTPP